MANLRLISKLNDISRRAKNVPEDAAKRATSRLFAGDPVEVNGDVAGDAIIGETEPADVAVQSIVAEDSEPAAAAEKLAAFESLSMTEQAMVMRLSPLAIWNAILVQEPVVSKLLAANVNYFVQKMMVDYPAVGGVIAHTDTTGAVDTGLKITPNKAGMQEPGKKLVVPFFRFNISASQLQARPGGNYALWLTGVDEKGEEFSTPEYAFQRKDITKPITGIYIPFDTISNRVLPRLAVIANADQGGEGEVALWLHIRGLDTTEVVTISVMGYSMAELRDVCKMYKLGAGLAQ